MSAGRAAAAERGTRPALAPAPNARPSTAGSSSDRPAERSSNQNDRPAASTSRSSASASASASASGSGSSTRRRRPPADGADSIRVPLSPPRDPDLFDTDDEWKRFHDEEPEGWPHYIPLLLVAVPSLGAVIHGRAEHWSDGILLLLVAFYLYQLVKVPWSIYRASHARYIIAGSVFERQGEDPDELASARRRAHAIKALRRNELLALLATVVVPAAGSYLLLFVKGILSDPDRYINKRIITLFALATSVKPLLHFAKLAKSSSLYYQEAVWYPSTEVHLLRRRIDSLERDLSQLSRAFATKDDVRLLRDGVDVPLLQLSKAVRRFDRKEEYLRLSSEERFNLLDQRLEDAQRDAQATASILEQLRDDHERYAHPVTAALHVLGAVLGFSRRGRSAAQREVRWYEKGPFWLLLWPVNVSSLAIEWVSTTKDDLAFGDGDERAPSQGHKSPKLMSS